MTGFVESRPLPTASAPPFKTRYSLLHLDWVNKICWRNKQFFVFKMDIGMAVEQ